MCLFDFATAFGSECVFAMCALHSSQCQKWHRLLEWYSPEQLHLEQNRRQSHCYVYVYMCKRTLSNRVRFLFSTMVFTCSIEQHLRAVLHLNIIIMQNNRKSPEQITETSDQKYRNAEYSDVCLLFWSGVYSNLPGGNRTADNKAIGSLIVRSNPSLCSDWLWVTNYCVIGLSMATA